MTTATMEPVLLKSLPSRPSDIAKSMRGDPGHRESETSAQSLPPSGVARLQSRPPLNRGQSQVQMALNGSANFVGWNDSEGEIRRNWGSKRLRFLAKKYNLNQHRALTEARSLDPGPYDDVDYPIDSSHGREGSQTQNHPSSHTDQTSSFAFHYAVSPSTCDSTTPASVARSLSQASETCSRLRSERRESAARLAYGTAASVAKRGFISTHRMHRVRLSSRQSFDMDFSESDQASSPASIGSQDDPELMLRPDFVQSARVVGENLRRRTGSVIEEEPQSDISVDHEPTNAISQSELLSRPKSLEANEFEMVEMGKSLEHQATVGSIPIHDEPHDEPLSVAASRGKSAVHKYDVGDDLFFAFSSDDDQTISKPASVVEKSQPWSTIIPLHELPILPTSTGVPGDHIGGISRMDIGDGRLHIPIGRVALGPVPEEDRVDVSQPDRPLLDPIKHLNRATRYPLLKQASVMEANKKYVVEGVLKNLGRHSGRLFLPRYRRYRGLGALSTFYDGSLHTEKINALTPEVREIIETGSDERPLFTWWVTIVQVLVCIVSLVFYGIGPVGWERVEMKGEVVDVSLIMRHVSYYEPVNHWIGPRFADLIRLGAKYSPCMRREPGLWRLIEDERRKENATGCCVFNDRTGCYQTRQSSCPHSLATWDKWSKPMTPPQSRSKSDSSLFDDMFNASTPSRRRGSMPSAVSRHSWRTAGAVCGQDPDFCKRPSSVRPYEWPDDLTRWPICEEPRQGAFLPAHMTCQVTGRPCCIQMQGQCRIATREYCDFVKGHYHENATLCSQVNCFSDICGMLPFLWRDQPDQFYRMFLSLFLHAGIIHCAFTVFVQLWLMLDLEMLIGWKRMAILYIGSGIGGNFASAIFVPYSPEVGPSGSHLGIMAALVVDLHHHRHVIVRPQRELMKHMLTVFVLFLTGLLPWIDNWAHLFGFVFGLLITIVTFPYLDFKSDEKPKFGCRSSLSRRHFAIVIALMLCIFLYSLLGYVYYHKVEVNCSWCQYFNCINIKYITGSDHFCDNTGQKLSQWLPI